MNRIERHIVIGDRNLDNLCFLSKNLYNYCNFLIRQEFINNHKLLSEYELTSKLAREKQIDYIALPAQTNQQVVKLLFKNWESFFKLCKVKNKLNGKPKLPKYKDKIKGRNIVIFTSQQCKLKNGYVCFPKKANIKPIKTKVDNIKQVRIVPKCSCFAIEIVYDKKKQTSKLNNDAYLSIDLGLNNLITSYDPLNNKSFIVNGRPLKSINQYYNKRKAFLMSCIGNRGTSKRIRKITLKRECKINDYMHKASNLVINYCLKNNIGNVVIGNNKDWKQKCNMGKRNNQNFVSVPFEKIISMIQYKSEEYGINVIITEESYTSKVDHFANEEMCKHEHYLGKRVKRGLFKSSTGKIVNADTNGAIGILRKVADEKFKDLIVSRGDVVSPTRLNV